MQEILQAFEHQGGPHIQMSTASSGVLATQIQHGAPFHAFLSANEFYPQRLVAAGLTQGEPRSLVSGQLILWSKRPLEGPLSDVLTSPDKRRMAIAHPELAPYGTAATHWLQDQHLAELWEKHLVFGENVGQVNQYIRSNSVDLALTARSASLSKELAKHGHWSMPLAGTEHWLPQVWVRLQDAPAAVHELEQFLDSEVAQSILGRYGYLSQQMALMTH